MTIILGIESSCDETGIGIVRLGTDGSLTLLADEVASSVDQHARFGGVVPEVASRAHLEALVPSVTRAFESAQLELSDVDAIAVTCGPGLAGALLVGVSAAKAYAAALNVPLYGANHLPGHVAADTLEHGPLPSPCLALLVSGGHTQLLRVDDLATKITEVGSTIDDAAGEAYDKVARILGLPYPGGPPIDKAARRGNPAAIHFPRGLTGPRDAPYDFSFSGLKTAVARWVERHTDTASANASSANTASGNAAGADIASGSTSGNASASGSVPGTDIASGNASASGYASGDVSGNASVTAFGTGTASGAAAIPVDDVAASFQEAVADVLTAKAVRAAVDLGIGTLVVSGGVAANSRLSALARERCAEAGIELRVPRPRLCTDNGAMIAALGAHLVAAGVKPSSLDLSANPGLPVGIVSV